MNEALDALTQSFLHKNMAESTIEEIRAVTQSYPYFAPAQLALLQKLKQENDPAYDRQMQKAVLYYYDPLQFEAYVHTEKFVTGFHFDIADTTEPTTDIVPDTAEDITGESGEAPVAIITEPIPESKEESTNTTEPYVPAGIAPPEETKEPAATIYTEEVPADNMAETFDNTAIPSDSPPTISLPEKTAEEPLAFEPYHTVDYFASQGIKLSQEDVSADRFGKQLKSFTEWLKTMKRLPAATMDKNIDSSGENNVQHLAEHSVETTDIVTETMAEVWLKQGNAEKAIEVYNKLSLQNPAKRTYFAAKMDQLKKLNNI